MKVHAVVHQACIGHETGQPVPIRMLDNMHRTTDFALLPKGSLAFPKCLKCFWCRSTCIDAVRAWQIEEHLVQRQAVMQGFDLKTRRCRICKIDADIENAVPFLGDGLRQLQRVAEQRRNAYAQPEALGIDGALTDRIWGRFNADYFLRHTPAEIDAMARGMRTAEVSRFSAVIWPR